MAYPLGVETLSVPRQQVSEAINAFLHVLTDHETVAYSDYGSVEGQLIALLMEADGTYQAKLAHDVSKQVIICRLKSTMLSAILTVFAQRLSVWGKIDYNREGKVLAIEVESFRALAEPESLPSIDEVITFFRESAAS